MNTMHSMRSGLICLSLISALIITSCQKESSRSSSVPPGKQNVSVLLNDDPVPSLSSVMLDIRYVEVKVDTGAEHHEDSYYEVDHEGDDGHHDGEGPDHHHGDKYGKWDTLSVTPRIYDLLKLKNGKDTLIAGGLANIGKITKLRITLGPNSTVWTDSAHSYLLPICDGQPYAYVRITSKNIDSTGGGNFIIHLDFDVARSIEMEDDDSTSLCLKPCIKAYKNMTSGSITGHVGPESAHPLIMAYSSSDTAYAIPEDEGYFMIRGLRDSVYSVLFKARLPFKDTTVSNVHVQIGTTTKLPDIMLHQ